MQSQQAREALLLSHERDELDAGPAGAGEHVEREAVLNEHCPREVLGLGVSCSGTTLARRLLFAPSVPR